MSHLTYVLILCFLIVLPFRASQAAVSSEGKNCITRAIAEGSAALGNRPRLNALYSKYFVEEHIAKVSAGGIRWRNFSKSQRQLQRDRVRAFVVSEVAPRLAKYARVHPVFTNESLSGSIRKIKGVVTATDGTRQGVTWHLAKSGCKFYDISVDGAGSMTGLIGTLPKEHAR